MSFWSIISRKRLLLLLVSENRYNAKILEIVHTTLRLRKTGFGCKSPSTKYVMLMLKFLPVPGIKNEVC